MANNPRAESVTCGKATQFIFLNLNWTNIFLHIGLAIVLAWLYISHAEPTHRFYIPTDPAISYPIEDEIVSTAVATFVPLLFNLFTMFFIELLVNRDEHATLTSAFYKVGHFYVVFLTCFVFTAFTQQLSAVAVGELRPSFLAICQRDPVTGDCANPDKNKVLDGRKAFFSGHASSAGSGAIFDCCYVLAFAFFKAPANRWMYQGLPLFSLSRWLHEVRHTAALLWMMLVLTYAYVTGVSRIVGNKHSVADVTCGFLVGTILAVLYFMYALGSYRPLPANLQHGSETEACGGDQGGEEGGGADRPSKARRADNMV